jgi:hypothetical protein
LLQKNEAKQQAKVNFDSIDCDKNSGLDRAEIKTFLDGKLCSNQVSNKSIYHQKSCETGFGPFPAII